jgi:hypothetical protein
VLGKSKLREERQGAGNAAGEQTKRQGGRVRKRASCMTLFQGVIVDTHCDEV